MAERLGNRLVIVRLPVRFPAVQKGDVVSLGKAPYLPRGNVPVLYCKSLWIRASAKCKCKKAVIQ